ncbi:MAG: Gmad2 immunoglobulin-like domain-containing protein [Patescibacteria group bacterium]
MDNPSNKKTVVMAIGLIVLLIVIIAGLVVWFSRMGKTKQTATVTNFEECVAAGNPVMESYPRQCRDGDNNFTENIGNELDKSDLIRLDTPRPNQVVKSPLTISGQARGVWFFEASFPVFLVDWDGRIIAQGIATAEEDWMTENFVPFTAILEFTPDENVYSNRGALILRKDNPSGLPEHDDALEIPVLIEK